MTVCPATNREGSLRRSTETANWIGKILLRRKLPGADCDGIGRVDDDRIRDLLPGLVPRAVVPECCHQISRSKPGCGYSAVLQTELEVPAAIGPMVPIAAHLPLVRAGALS